MSNRHLINNISGEICQENVSTEMCPTHCMAGDIEEIILEVVICRSKSGLDVTA